MQARKINVTWASYGPVSRGLQRIADAVSWGTFVAMPHQGETDEHLLDRVSREKTQEFLALAGDATGADGFAFSAEFRE